MEDSEQNTMTVKFKIAKAICISRSLRELFYCHISKESAGWYKSLFLFAGEWVGYTEILLPKIKR